MRFAEAARAGFVFVGFPHGASLEADDFDLELLFDGVFAAELGIDGVEDFGVVVTASTSWATLCFDIFDNIEFSVQAMLLGNLLLDRFSTAEFTFHGSSTLA